MNVTRRSFLAGGLAALGGLCTPEWLGGIAFGRGPRFYTRYNVNTAHGKLMLEKLASAIDIMRSDKYADCDPRSYTFQWFTHWTQEYQAFQYEKSTTYKKQYIQDNCQGQDAILAAAMWNGCQAHGIDNNNPRHFQEWFFPPWHRLYLYYFEQIVRYVISDSDFSLPYWNPASGEVADLSIPAAFRDTSSPLYDSTRYSPINSGTRIDNVVLAPNWLNMSCLNEPSYIDSATGSFGFCPSVDINPHFLVHIGLGGHMSDGFNTVVEDPIFWVHHANIDRLWESWTRLRGRRNPNNPRWLNRTFTWANPRGNPVDVQVSDARRVYQLGYDYDCYSEPPRPRKFSDRDLSAASKMPKVMVASASGGPVLGAGAVVMPLPPVAAEGERTVTPLARRVEALAPGRQIYLVLKGLQAKADPKVAYGVYLDLPKGSTPSANDPHFAGVLTFMEVARMNHEVHCNCHGSTFTYNVTETLEKLNANKMLDPKAHAVTLVPNGTPSTQAKPVIGQIALIEV